MPEVILPCPACGSIDCECLFAEDEMYSVDCVDCSMRGPAERNPDSAIAAWNALPRALTWTHEPPKVAGFYWHIGSDMSIYSDISGIMTVYAQNGELGYLKNGEFCTKFEADDQWAGPIPVPVEE